MWTYHLLLDQYYIEACCLVLLRRFEFIIMVV